MEGKLARLNDKWVIAFIGLDGTNEILPIHSDDSWLDSCDGNEGAIYEFDIIKNYNNSKSDYDYYAKLISKVHKLDKWDAILEKAENEGIQDVKSFVTWLKEYYKAPIKI